MVLAIYSLGEEFVDNSLTLTLTASVYSISLLFHGPDSADRFYLDLDIT